MPTLHRTIVRPIITEKTLGGVSGRAASTRSRCIPTRRSRRSAQAIEQLFGVKVTGVWTSNVRGKAKRMGKTVGRRPNWKKAIVTLRDGRHDRDLRGLRAHGHSSIQAGDQGHAFPLGLGFRRDHAHDAGEVAARAAQEVAAGATTTATSRCAAAAAVTSGSTASSTSSATSSACRPRSTTIEYDPNRSARIALVDVRGRREALHPAPEGTARRRHDRVGSGLGRPHRQRAAAGGDAARHRRCTTSSSRSARAARWRARPACRRRSSRRKAST